MTADPLEHIPPPEAVRAMLAESIRRSDLLRSLLRVSKRKAAHTTPSVPNQVNTPGGLRPATQATEVSRG